MSAILEQCWVDRVRWGMLACKSLVSQRLGRVLWHEAGEGTLTRKSKLVCGINQRGQLG